ncbi:hypothetical protein JXL19_04780 [bacterium]|nr:hypothetical protein [bacterium]
MKKDRPKIIGLLAAWGAEDWIRPALRQSVKYCDDVFVCVAAHSEELKAFEDNTLSIVETFPGIKTISCKKAKNTHASSKAKILNRMLEESRHFKPGNWIWILDVDEFYPEPSYKKILSLISGEDYDNIYVGNRFFLIDMQHYIKASHQRLFKIKPIHRLPFFRFRPTQQWPFLKKPYKLPLEEGMFHYSLLTNPHMRRVQWENEYKKTRQTQKTKWLDLIYRNYDLGNEDYWIQKNYELTGIKSPWFNNDFLPDHNGRLFSYTGKHPSFIEEAGLPEIGDFRKRYDFR